MKDLHDRVVRKELLTAQKERDELLKKVRDFDEFVASVIEAHRFIGEGSNVHSVRREYYWARSALEQARECFRTQFDLPEGE